jgi:hypothetical protein
MLRPTGYAPMLYVASVVFGKASDIAPRKWALTVVAGTVLGVLSVVVKLQLPGLDRDPAPSSIGQIIVNEGNGQLVLIDPSGQSAPASIALPPRVRISQARREMDPGTPLVGPQSVWWDAQRSVFLGVSTQRTATGRRPIIDSAITEYYGDGTPRREALTSSVEALETVTVSPRGKREILSGDTLLPDGASVSLLERGHQRVITRDSRGPASWRSDEALVAYGCSIDHGSPQLCTYVLSSRVQRAYELAGITDIHEPAFAPDGSSVAFAADVFPTQAEALIVMRLPDGLPSIVVEDARYKQSPQWDPTGQFLCFATGQEIVLIAVKTRQERHIHLGAPARSLQWVPTPRVGFGVP